ncbi:MAG: hypothetical protein A2Y25_03565 [Candidatus Melainabacteria bacterium GWF2_37_15]|nr:MAG: hypothetical protein A2Y25_03565 [Candidatus Melainabacteria bacterium GWF2_37_15]
MAGINEFINEVQNTYMNQHGYQARTGNTGLRFNGGYAVYDGNEMLLFRWSKDRHDKNQNGIADEGEGKLAVATDRFTLDRDMYGNVDRSYQENHTGERFIDGNECSHDFRYDYKGADLEARNMPHSATFSNNNGYSRVNGQNLTPWLESGIQANRQRLDEIGIGSIMNPYDSNIPEVVMSKDKGVIAFNKGNRERIFDPNDTENWATLGLNGNYSVHGARETRDGGNLIALSDDDKDPNKVSLFKAKDIDDNGKIDEDELIKLGNGTERVNPDAFRLYNNEDRMYGRNNLNNFNNSNNMNNGNMLLDILFNWFMQSQQQYGNYRNYGNY